MDIAELKRKSVSELQDVAEGLKIPDTITATKPELIFRIEQNLLDSNVALHGEGVLEILPE
ncbi:MAG: Rho termination factor N-terminal domain-containing protein, partial [Gemmatimonadales bacterium]